MSDDPENDINADWPDEMSFPGDGVVRMEPSGPTDFGIGKNIRGFSDSIDGCNMDFSETAERGYAYKADDARDVEIKCLLKMDGTGDNGFSISACTGHHTSDGCCQGFAYMITVEVADDPSKFNFRKEMWHVSYHPSPLGEFTHSKCNFQIEGCDHYVGIGFCRYNKTKQFEDGSSRDAVVVEVWFNPNPETSLTDWTMLKRFEDDLGKGWGNDGDECGGERDQVGTWSNAQNRFKTNAENGTCLFKAVTLREIDPTRTLDQDPGGTPGVPPPVVTPGLTYTYSYKWGSEGTGNGEFLDPHDITFDASGNVFVCDRERNDVQKFTHLGVYISKFGGPGNGDGQFNVPYSIAHSPSGQIYVADRDNNRIQRLDSAGAYISKITTVNGKALNAPEDITFDTSNGDIYIADTGNNRVVKLDSNHNFILQWGSTGTNNGQFNHLHSIDVDPTNAFVICSSGDQPYVQKFTSTGAFVKKWGSEGNGQGQVRMFLEHLDVDGLGRVHLINNDIRPIINVWNLEGVWLTQYGATTKGSANGQFSEPEHVTVDTDGKPFVVDSGNFRIQVFTVNNVTTTPPPPVQPPPDGGTTKQNFSFTLQRDINQIRVSACQGSGGGGGSGGSGKFYEVLADRDKELSDTEPWEYRTRIAAQLISPSHAMKGRILHQLDVPIKKVGTPAASPTVTAVIWNSSGTPIYTSPTAIAPTTLTTSFVTYSFDFSANTHAFAVGDMVGIRYFADSPTSHLNYVVGSYESVSSIGGTQMIQVQNSIPEEKPTRDFACTMWD